MQALAFKKMKLAQTVLGVSCITFAAAILFAVPDAYLASAGRHKEGFLFFGLAEVFGKFGARYFFSLPFAVLGFVVLRRAWQWREHEANSSLHTDAKRRRST